METTHFLSVYLSLYTHTHTLFPNTLKTNEFIVLYHSFDRLHTPSSAVGRSCAIAYHNSSTAKYRRSTIIEHSRTIHYSTQSTVVSNRQWTILFAFRLNVTHKHSLETAVALTLNWLNSLFFVVLRHWFHWRQVISFSVSSIRLWVCPMISPLEINSPIQVNRNSRILCQFEKHLKCHSK